MAYLLNHGITDTCPSLKIYNNTDELRVNVNGGSQNNVKLLMSCHCKLRFTMFSKSSAIIQNSLFFLLVSNKYYLGCRNDNDQFTELAEFEGMSIDHCRNQAHLSGYTIFGQTYREKNNYNEEHDYSWKSYPIKCVVADTEDDMLNAGESDTCNLQYYFGSITAISFFRVVDSPTNHVYPFEGLRTMNDAKAFCATQGGPETKFGLDDNDAQTEGM